MLKKFIESKLAKCKWVVQNILSGEIFLILFSVFEPIVTTDKYMGTMKAHQTYVFERIAKHTSLHFLALNTLFFH